MVPAVTSTFLDFASLYVLYQLVFCPLPPRAPKSFDRSTALWLVFAVLTSVYYILPIRHWFPINVLLLIVAQLFSLMGLSWKVRLCYSISSTCVLVIPKSLISSLFPNSVLASDWAEPLISLLALGFTLALYFSCKRTDIPAVLRRLQEKYAWITALVLILLSLFIPAFLQRLDSLELQIFLENHYTGAYLSYLLHIWRFMPTIASAFLLLMIILAVVIGIRQHRSSEHDLLLQYEQSFQVMDSFIAEIKRENHDYKNHINYLRNLITTADSLDDARQNVTEYSVRLTEESSFADVVLALDNTIYKALLYGCYLKCRANDISFSFSASDFLPAFPLEDYQLVNVIENLISNAVNYNTSLTDASQRFLRIDLFADSEYNKIRITNPYFESPETFHKERKGTISDKLMNKHGIGLSSVKEILENTEIRFYREQESPSSISFVISYDQPSEK